MDEHFPARRQHWSAVSLHPKPTDADVPPALECLDTKGRWVLRRPVSATIDGTSVCVLDRAPIECALGGVRQGSDDLDPIGYFELGQLTAAGTQDLLCRGGIPVAYDYGADTLPIHRIGDGENGVLGYALATRENGFDVLG